MSTDTKPRRSDPWVTPADPAEEPEAGHVEHVRAAVIEGRRQIQDGQGIPAEQVWKDLGIE